MSGSNETVFQMAMIIVLIFDFGGFFGIIETALIWISLILTVVSLVDYIKKNIGVLKDGNM